MKKIIIILFLLCNVQAQAQQAPLYHGIAPSNTWYNDTAISHTAMQPYFETRSETTSNNKWLKRALFDDSFLKFNSEQANIYVNYLPTFSIGKQWGSSASKDNRNLWNNTRGFQVGGTVNKNFSFDLQIFENQTLFPSYLDSTFSTRGVILGHVYFIAKVPNSKAFDYQYSVAHIAYQSGNFSFVLGNDKLFIGDGYRSVILSDVAVPYPYFKASYASKKIQYSAIYMQHTDASAPILSEVLGLQKKWAAMHYLDWNISKKLTIGLFDAVIWQDADSSGKRGFDATYANPIIFLRAAEYNTASSDNALVGLTLKYKLNSSTKIYGQLMLDELKVSEYTANKGWWANKFAMQLGVKSAKVFGIQNTFGFTEINLAKPYMYTHRNSQRSYSHFNDALAHPLGANFIESVTRLEQQYKNFRTFIQINYARYGADSTTGNVGNNILLSYNTRNSEYGNKILQGVNSSLLYVDARLAYVINPKVNFCIELGYVYRNQQNAGQVNSANQITLALKTGFRNLYWDR
jgi:hypothetical protein